MHTFIIETSRFWRQLMALIALLALLFAVLQPPATSHMQFPVALLSWLLHIGIGMVCALVSMGGLLRGVPPLRRRPWLALASAGLLGGMLFAPVALGLETLFPPPPAKPSDDWLDHWEAVGGWHAVVAEYLSLLPSYLTAWILANASPMILVSRPRLAADDMVDRTRGGHTEAMPALSKEASLVGLHVLQTSDDTPLLLAAREAAPLATEERGTAGKPECLLERLPVAVGRQLISITADLHYLHVTTRRGRATILGSLAEAEADLGQRGLRIHRSHWVALEAVRRLRRTTKGMRCELADGRLLPISRRRVAVAIQRLGTDFVVDE